MPKIRSSTFSHPYQCQRIFLQASLERLKSNSHYRLHNYNYTKPVRDGRSTKRLYDPRVWFDEAARRASGQHMLRRPSVDIFESQGRTIYNPHHQASHSRSITRRPNSGGYLSSPVTPGRSDARGACRTSPCQRRSSFHELQWVEEDVFALQLPTRRRMEGLQTIYVCKTEEGAAQSIPDPVIPTNDTDLVTEEVISDLFEVDGHKDNVLDGDASCDSWSAPTAPSLNWSSPSSPSRLGQDTIPNDADVFIREYIPSEAKKEEPKIPCLDESVDHLFDLFINSDACEEI